MMPQGIINPLKMIQIQEQECKMIIISTGIFNGLIQSVHKEHPVGQSCQSVIKNKKPALFFCLAQLSDILNHPQAQGGLPIQPIILIGGIMVTAGGMVCAITKDLWILIGARFLQGLFIPSLTICLAAYLAKSLPAVRLNIVMGSYVSATVLGGLCGRLLGGWIHPPLHWRYAFVSASVLTFAATIAAVRGLPRTSVEMGSQNDSIGFLDLMKRRDLFRIYLCAMGGFAIFSSVFNYLPYRLSDQPFNFSTGMTTLLYLVGIFIGQHQAKSATVSVAGTLCWPEPLFLAGR